jgi:Ni,Fe-hydrogenase III large subunit
MAGWWLELRPEAEASHSSFHESLIPMRALNAYAQSTGSRRARAVVKMAGEMFLERRLFRRKTTGEVRIKPKTIEPGSEAVGLNEAPRGELYYYIRAGGTDVPEYMMPEGKHNVQGSNQPQCVRIRTPSYRNNACLPYMLKGCELADVPVIMGSVDQCLACTDRVEVINAKDERAYSLSWEELVRMSQKRWRE